MQTDEIEKLIEYIKKFSSNIDRAQGENGLGSAFSPAYSQRNPPDRIVIFFKKEKEMSKCSECGGEVILQGDEYVCLKCGRRRKTDIVETIDMSERSNLEVIMD